MKRLLAIIPAIFLCLAAVAAPDVKWKKVEASQLNLCGKAFDTPNPYHRIDTVVFKGFDKRENEMCREPAGLTVLFKTDAERIGISVTFGDVHAGPFASYRGFDLYIKKDGKWLWAGQTTFDRSHKDPEKVQVMVSSLAPGEKECLLYLPIYSEVNMCKVCVPEGSSLESLESPFRHKIVFHGSSFTHGVSCTRAGMSYPMQFMRRTGLQVIPLGFSGHCKMQPYFADVLEKVEADAYVFDPFSNSGVKNFEERLEGFIVRMVKAHPGKPIIIQRTIYWEKENFDTKAQAEYSSRRAYTDSIMPILHKRYPDVYYLKPDAALHNGESSTADGVHPNDNGYSLWEASIEKPILKILKKYGIKP
ncbi:MAG: SGNH/GDSL hydrolase family protein [Bacteroidales bacterium]|nr:SGNH/GDSL hydrolase family protein [Bacteroidales bacterium]